MPISEHQIPMIDISSLYREDEAARQKTGSDIITASQTHGFFYIQGYDIPEHAIEDVFNVSRSFFTRDDHYKNQYSIIHSDRFQGYEPPTEKESKEAYVLGPERPVDDRQILEGIKYQGVNTWPDQSGFKQAVLPFMYQMLSLAKMMNRGLAYGLGIPPDYFDARSRDPMYAFRMLHYPPAKHNHDHGIDTHTDWGALSLLIQDGNKGLEIQTLDGQFISIPPIDKAIVVNIGEMVERWTNGHLRATPHRVRNQTPNDRYSLAFFLDMDHDAVIEPISGLDRQNAFKYDPITVSDFIDLMHKRDYG